MPDPQRAIHRACRGGAGLGLLVFLFVLCGNQLTLLGWQRGGGFYDAQAHALVAGHLDINPDALGIEAFFHGGRAYLYQPPFPALLRLPVAAMTDRFDGRLTQVSMLLAALVGAVALERCAIGVRRAMRPNAAAPRRFETIMLGLLAFVVVGGASPTYLASRAWVYHEAALWGMVWALAAFASMLDLRADPTRRRLAVTSGLTLLCLMSRASVGAGPVAALLVLWLAGRREGRATPERPSQLRPAAFLLAAALPCAAFVGVNLAKFGTVASIPFAQQGATLVDEDRRAMLAENGGTLFGPQFVPTTLLHYLRPSGLRFGLEFPFVDFPPPGRPVIGNVTFDLIDHTASLPTSLPALTLPAGLGAVALLRRRHWPAGADRVGIGVAMAGGVAGSLTILPFGYIAHRYQADVMPLLVVGALVGWQVLARPHRTRRRAGAGVAAAGVLVVLTTWTTLGLALLYQRLYAPNAPPALVESLLEARVTVSDRLGRETSVRSVSVLPTHGQPGELVALGECDALYQWDTSPVGSFRRTGWIPVERGPVAGHIRVEADLSRLEAGPRYPLVVRDDPAGVLVLWVRAPRPGRVAVGFDGPGLPDVGHDRPVSGRRTVDVVLDPNLGQVQVLLGDEILFEGTLALGAPIDHLVVGRARGIHGLEPVLPAAAALPPDPMDLCRRLASR